MEDKLVMGRRATGDGLKDLERFAGNESEVVFPEWKQKLFDRMKFECGQVAVDVVEGRFKAESVRVGEDIDTVTGLVNMLIASNRTGIKFDARSTCLCGCRFGWRSYNAKIAFRNGDYDGLQNFGHMHIAQVSTAKNNCAVIDGSGNCGVN